MSEPGFRDLDRLRRKLSITSQAQVWLVMGCAQEGIVAGFECQWCEELLQWQAHEKWWVCPRCGQELNRDQGVELFRTFRDYLTDMVQDDLQDNEGQTDDGKGVRRWLRLVREILNR